MQKIKNSKIEDSNEQTGPLAEKLQLGFNAIWLQGKGHEEDAENATENLSVESKAVPCQSVPCQSVPCQPVSCQPVQCLPVPCQPGMAKIENSKIEEPKELDIEQYLKSVLVEDWETPLKPVPSELKLNIPISKPFIEGLKCASNPELDPYIKKPKFSRDRNDYEVARSGYNPRKLVCAEIAKTVGLNTIYETVPCTEVPEFSEVLTIVTENEERFKSAELPFSSPEISAEEITTPYVFLGSGQFDFDPKDANLIRMVREAELQNADVVAGAFKAEVADY